MRSVEIQFRGIPVLVIIDFSSGYDPETNTREIEWHFDGINPIEHERLMITDKEEQEIYEALCFHEDEHRGTD